MTTDDYKKYYDTINNEYVCDECYYITSIKCNIIKHLKTRKHTMTTKSIKSINNKSDEVLKTYICECGNEYSNRQNLYRHRKKCLNKEIKKENINNTLLNIPVDIQSTIEKLEYENEILNLRVKILEMTKDNQVMKDTLQSINLNNSFNTITNNNIKIFLSEKCADAISIQDFVSQLTISLDDIVKTKDNNVKGITSIIEKNLKPFSITTRPVHSIEKNEWYIKDNQEWKEDDGNSLVEKAHHKIQRECLKAYTDIEDDTHTDEQMEILVLGTSELNQASATYIKEQLSDICTLKSM